ncbi:MAG: hypothetical protein COS34_11930 [Lysobacterales bacterium CG02_land_8_20_14_3_00_62_12]|nr:MAG: hypothetical protein COS34_11930 [Xanthomonadales bacterium CG02_land_8_20_14_3_00_62_12]
MLAMAISLVVHLAVLLALLRPTPPTSLPAPTQTFASTGLQLELIDPIEAESAAVQPMFLASRKTTAATLVRSSARATATASAAPPRPLAASAHPPNTTASLLAGIATAAAAEANAVPKSRWSPAAQPLLLLPGRAQPFIAVPLPHRQRRSTQDVVVGMLRLIGGTMAAHPDAMGDQGTLIDPLRAQLGRLAHDHPDLDCSDPENPSLDPRCLQMH